MMVESERLGLDLRSSVVLFKCENENGGLKQRASRREERSKSG
jgi:hypothetical protein